MTVSRSFYLSPPALFHPFIHAFRNEMNADASCPYSVVSNFVTEIYRASNDPCEETWIPFFDDGVCFAFVLLSYVTDACLSS